MRYRKYFQSKSTAEQIKTLYLNGVPVRMYDPLQKKWFSPIQDTVRKPDGTKPSLKEIYSVVHSLSPHEKEIVREKRRANRDRAKQIQSTLDNRFSLPYHYKAVQLGYAYRARPNVVYRNFFTGNS